MPKYIFETGGETDFFKAYVDKLTSTQPTNPDDEQTDQPIADDQDTEFIRDLRQYDDTEDRNKVYESLSNKFDSLQELLDTRLGFLEKKSQEYDWFQDADNLDELTNSYDTRRGLDRKYTVPHESVNSDSPWGGIFKNEGANVGQPTNLNSSAVGRGQMVRGTRVAMYKKLGFNDLAMAEQKFKTDPNFEMQVMNAYRTELSQRIPEYIQGQKREYMIAKGWYTGDPNYPDNKVPHPEAGNRITAGEYARRATKNNN